MNLKHTFVMTWCLLLASGLWTACNDDAQSLLPPAEPEEEQPILGEGQFLVSYGTTTSAGRALSEGSLPTAQRISSLHYFVYDSVTGNLIKKRQIRDINANTHWPIGSDRGKMSWELRQDLQDTLMEGPIYRILFIANVDSTLFVKADGKPHPEIVRNVKQYSSAQILLPEVPFSDHNMYYLWEGSLKADAGTTVKRKDVKLQRLVTRTDVRRIEIPDTNQYLMEFVDRTLYDDNTLEGLINAHITNFCTRMTDNMTGDYKNHAKKLSDLLSSEPVKTLVKAHIKEQVTSDYIKVIQASVKYDKKTSEWPIKGKVTVEYEEGSRVNVMSFNRTPSKDPQLPQIENLEVSNGKFTIVGFSGDKQQRNNGIVRLTFAGESPVCNFEIANDTLWLEGDMNMRYEAECSPVDGIDISRLENTYHPEVDFYKLLENNETWKELKDADVSGIGGTFFENVQSKVFDGKSGLGTDYSIYGKHFDEFKFSNMKIPKITKEDIESKVDFIPFWKSTLIKPTTDKPKSADQ